MHTPDTIQQLYSELAGALPPGTVSIDAELLDTFARDESPDLRRAPEILARADSTEAVSTVLRLCSRYGVPVTPRGCGTGVAGGAVPIRGGVALSLDRMDRIIEIDRENMTATVEPGVITARLQDAAAEAGLMYPPDPSSLDSCSIGGNVAVGAGGPRAVKYGTTRDYVIGLEFVTVDGCVHTAGGKFIKNATGYSLIGLLIGSEGTLAVITKITVRLVPAPLHVIDVLAPYPGIDEALRAVTRVLTGGVSPSTIEFMEEDAVRLVAAHLGHEMPLPGARAHLLIQLDGGTEEEVTGRMERLAPLLDVDPEKILVAVNRAQRNTLWKARRAIREAITRESPEFLAEDTVVPRAAIPLFLRELKNRFERQNLRSVMFGHAGDGNVHVDVLRDAMGLEEWRTRLPGIKRMIYETAIAYGGTISGEHGIGALKKEYLGMACGESDILLMRSIKEAFDPRGILNPGKIV